MRYRTKIVNTFELWTISALSQQLNEERILAVGTAFVLSKHATA
jgi:hypothetical protein